MKKKFLPIFFALGFYSAYSQVSIGKKDANPSSQLEVFATDKGVLFPRVALTSLTDSSTIVKGNVNSLLVFNTATALNVKPGYYYWYINKWNRIAISDEITSDNYIASGNGVPKERGQNDYPGASIIVYTDIDTGIAYIQKPDGTWISINGKGGNNGIGIKSSSVDLNGNLIITYTDGSTYNAGRVKGDIGPTGAPGLNGEKGDKGNNGIGIKSSSIDLDGNLIITYTDGSTYNAGKVKGDKGDVGPTGAPGLNGEKGDRGNDGIGIKSSSIDLDGNLIITYTDGSTYNAGKAKGDKGDVGSTGAPGLNGENGDRGNDGIGIKSSSIDLNGNLIITYTDGSTYNAGRVKGDKGDVGPTGAPGLNGEKGDKGNDGIGIKSSSIDLDGNLIITYTDGSTYNAGKAKGDKGDIGPTGAPGLNGEKGDKGNDGIGIKSSSIDLDGNLIITYTDGSTYNAGKAKGDKGDVGPTGAPGLNGENGDRGNDGIGIKSSSIDSNGNLIITYTDESTFNAGKVKGDKGEDGKDGIGGKTEGSSTINVAGLGTDESPYVVSTISKDLSTSNTSDILEVISGQGATLVDTKVNLVKGPVNTYLATDENGVLKWNDNPWLTKGNLGTDPSKDFLGTKDDKNLIFKRNKIQSGLLSVDNTSFGVSALNPGSSGISNVAFGSNALKANTTGSLNTAIGADVLKYNSTGQWNTAIGYGALSFNTIGQQNTAIGTKVLFNNGSGSANIGLGINTMNSNISGNDNIGVGNYASNLNKTGSGNISIGTDALRFSDAGNNNISIGKDSGKNVGATGGSLATLLDNSIFIGSNTRADAVGDTNEIVIGNNAVGRGSNTIQLGNTAITGVYTSGSMTAAQYLTSSDKRLKKDINDSSFGLNFITKLRPVTYFMRTGSTDLQTGFIAQEVEDAANSIDYKFSGVAKPASEQSFYSVNYATFVVPLVKAVQEQQIIIENQDKKISDLEVRLKKLEELLNK